MLAELRNDEDVREAAAILENVCETRRRRVEAVNLRRQSLVNVLPVYLVEQDRPKDAEAVNLRFGGKQGYKYDWCELVG